MDVVAALADPTRRRILELLVDGERSAGELAGEFTTSRPGVSRHLRVLRAAGLVSVRADGQRRLYAVEPAPLAELDAWLTPYRVLWAGRLDALGTEVRRGVRQGARESASARASSADHRETG